MPIPNVETYEGLGLTARPYTDWGDRKSIIPDKVRSVSCDCYACFWAEVYPAVVIQGEPETKAKCDYV